MDKETKEQFNKLERLILGTNEKVDKGFENVDKRFEKVDKGFENVDKRFEKVDKGFKSIDKRFEKVDKGFKSIDKRFEKVDKGFKSIDKRFEKIESKLDGMPTAIMVNKSFENIANDLKETEKNLKKYVVEKVEKSEENMKEYISAEIQKSKDVPVVRKVDSRVNRVVKTLKRKKVITENEEGVLLKSSPFPGELVV
jgi:uncharacterized phage infection (PIP) family protein YhgE